MRLALSDAGPALSPISPRREFGAYEALWLEKGATFKSLAEKFAALVPVLRDPQRVVGDVGTAIAEQSSDISGICSANQTPVTLNADYGA